MAKQGTKKSKAKKTPKLSAEEKKKKAIQNAHIRTARRIFRNLGFDRIAELTNKQIEFGDQSGEFDDVFVAENLIILVEYTSAQSSDITDHLKKKKIIFSKIVNDQDGFFKYLISKFYKDSDGPLTKFHSHKYVVKIAYLSRHEYDENIKNIVTETEYIDYHDLK